MVSTTCRLLTVVVDNVNRVLILREADSAALGQAHEHHGGTKQRKPHGWRETSTTSVATRFNYLAKRNAPVRFQQRRTLTGTSYCGRRGFSSVFEHCQQRTKSALMRGSVWTLMENCCVTRPYPKLL